MVVATVVVILVLAVVEVVGAYPVVILTWFRYYLGGGADVPSGRYYLGSLLLGWGC